MSATSGKLCNFEGTRAEVAAALITSYPWLATGDAEDDADLDGIIECLDQSQSYEVAVDEHVPVAESDGS